jgi:hypothetical protein
MTVTVVIAIANSLTPSRSSMPSRSSTPSAVQQTEDQLQAGDCLQGPDLGLDNSNPWPDFFTVVPCTQRHIAEVFFAGNVWPQSLSYPGDDATGNQADDRCGNAFITYVAGNQQHTLGFTYQFIAPDSDTWPGGDRLVVCIAYEPTAQYPGGAPVDYSIKGNPR